MIKHFHNFTFGDRFIPTAYLLSLLDDRMPEHKRLMERFAQFGYLECVDGEDAGGSRMSIVGVGISWSKTKEYWIPVRKGAVVNHHFDDSLFEVTV